MKSDKNQITRSEFALRTLSYYQKKGGFYNELITILLKLRDHPATARCIPPNRVINEASWLSFETEMADPPDGCLEVFKKNWGLIQTEYNPKDCALIKCVFFILLHLKADLNHTICPSSEDTLPPFANPYRSLSEKLGPEVTSETLFFPKFKHLLNPDRLVPGRVSETGVDDMYNSLEMKLASAQLKIQQLEAQVKELTEMGLVKDAENAQLQMDMAVIEAAFANTRKQSALDRSITFIRILDYIRLSKQYKFTTQIFMLLNWLMRNVATDEEYRMLDETLQYMQEQRSGDQTTVINNDNKNCNVINEAHDPVFGNPLHDTNR